MADHAASTGVSAVPVFGSLRDLIVPYSLGPPRHSRQYTGPLNRCENEYMVVIEGCYTLIMNGERVPLNRGDECLIPRGVAHSGEVLAGTRTIHAFGGRRAERAS